MKGVFTSLDPFEGDDELPLTRNGYTWVEGNIINLTDPSGNFSIANVFIAAGVALATVSIQKAKCNAAFSSSIDAFAGGAPNHLRTVLAPIDILAGSQETGAFTGMPLGKRIDYPQQEGVFAKGDGGWSGWSGVIGAGLAAFIASSGLRAEDLRSGSTPTDIVIPMPPTSTIPTSGWDVASFDDYILYAKKSDIKEYRATTRHAGIKNTDYCQEIWSQFVHEMKELAPGTKNARGDFKWNEFEDLASEFCNAYPECYAK